MVKPDRRTAHNAKLVAMAGLFMTAVGLAAYMLQQMTGQHAPNDQYQWTCFMSVMLIVVSLLVSTLWQEQGEEYSIDAADVYRMSEQERARCWYTSESHTILRRLEAPLHRYRVRRKEYRINRALSVVQRFIDKHGTSQ